jgi:hypothetical protein
MPDNLVGHTPVAGELDGHATMLQHGFMTTLDDVANEFFSASVRDFVLRFVAHAATLFEPRQNNITINWGDELYAWSDYLHNPSYEKEPEVVSLRLRGSVSPALNSSSFAGKYAS